MPRRIRECNVQKKIIILKETVLRQMETINVKKLSFFFLSYIYLEKKKIKKWFSKYTEMTVWIFKFAIRHNIFILLIYFRGPIPIWPTDSDSTSFDSWTPKEIIYTRTQLFLMEWKRWIFAVVYCRRLNVRLVR